MDRLNSLPMTVQQAIAEQTEHSPSGCCGRAFV